MARGYGPTTAIGTHVADHIKEKYRTQMIAAKAWGVSQAFISGIIRGRAYPPKWVLMAVGLDDEKVSISLCNCRKGQCKKAARECRDWIKRAANQQNKNG